MQDEEFVNQILDQLKSGEIREYFVKQDDFLVFRKALVQREDFKHFRGIAQRGGDVLYQYLEEARS